MTWFVEQQNFGSADQGAGAGQHLLFAPRKLRASVGLALAQRGEEFKEPRHGPRPGGTALSNLDVLDDGQVGKDQAALGHIGDAGAGNSVGWPARDMRA